jgi:hypothetical protein
MSDVKDMDAIFAELGLARKGMNPHVTLADLPSTPPRIVNNQATFDLDRTFTTAEFNNPASRTFARLSTI